jgi:four helix bundle protein
MLADFKDLKVYQKAYDLSMEIYQLSKTFPKEEIYSLTDQIRRASRSVCANIAEAYRKRRYPKLFKLSLTNADSEVSETLVWIDYAKDCGYISEAVHQSISQGYKEVGKILGRIISHPHRFIAR